MKTAVYRSKLQKPNHMSSKVISSRISLTQYQEILLECDRLELNVADWVQLQIARSNKWDTAKAEILGKLKSIKITASVTSSSTRLNDKIQNLLLYIENVL